jgi:hypothetical protein
MPIITQWVCNTSLKVYQKSFKLIEYKLKPRGVLPKPTRKVIPLG